MLIKPTELPIERVLEALRYWADDETDVQLYMQQVLSQVVGILEAQPIARHLSTKDEKTYTSQEDVQDICQSENCNCVGFCTGACKAQPVAQPINQMLLEALKDIERVSGLAAVYDDPVRIKARAAIAKAEGV